MTDAPKIDTQAPETLWLHHHAEAIGDKPERWWEYQDYIRQDVAAAREAAAAQAMREAAIARARDLPISEIAVDEVVYALEQLPLPDPAALDRMQAELAEATREIEKLNRLVSYHHEQSLKAEVRPDPAALDRLIAERVRDEKDLADELADALFDAARLLPDDLRCHRALRGKIERALAQHDAARGSMEGQS